MNATTTSIDATLARLAELRDTLRAEIAGMPFGWPGRDYRCTTLARIVRQIRDIKGE